jgi:hypothetical protein
VFDKAADTKLCDGEESCINSVSEMFYNSLLCNDGEVYKDGQCVMGGRVVYDLRGLGVLSDSSGYTEQIEAGDVLYLEDEIYASGTVRMLGEELGLNFRGQVGEQPTLYWCHKSDTGIDYSCFAEGYTMSSSDVKTLLKNGGQLYLSLANSESNCKAIDPDLTWNHGCYCEKGYMQIQDDICK